MTNARLTAADLAEAIASIPDFPNDEPLRYFANSESEAEWARNMWPGMPVVINQKIPTK